MTRDRGSDRQATGYLVEGLRLSHELGNKAAVAWALEGLAEVVSRQGAVARSARLLGAANGLRQAVAVPLPPAARKRLERLLGTLRAQISEAAWTAAWAEGRAMSLEQAVAYALEQEPTLL